MHHYGIRGIAHKWFVSYLNNRKQRVVYNNSQSCFKSIKCGVPQGSILGPLLFLLYINDLASVCHSSMPIFFADDTNLFLKGTDLKLMESEINKELNDISLWLKVNKLSLNIGKTHYMVFHSKNKCSVDMNIKIDNNIINRVSYTKFLGIIIDEKLNWKQHINYVSGKVSRCIGMIIKSRKVLNTESLLTLYYSFIYPFLIYCNHVWGSTYISHLNKLELLQKKIVRIISGVHPRCPSAPLFNLLGILKVQEINKYLLLKFMYKYHSSSLPNVFCSYFPYVSGIHDHATRQSNCLYIPSVRTNLGKTSIKYRGPILWNQFMKSYTELNYSEPVFSYKVKIMILNNTI